jgi:glycosyltransferase involved in cell wall biosynthesis
MRNIAVIPTYNEAENLPLLVPRLLERDARIEVLVVDDRSPDGTGKLADELALGSPRVHVLHRPEKQGLGPAYRAGFRRALELGADVILQMDADFSHPPEAVPTLLQEIESHDVVLGSRYLNGITVVNWPIERILISYFGNWYARKVTGLGISDATGGFRCMRRSSLAATSAAWPIRCACIGRRLRRWPPTTGPWRFARRWAPTRTASRLWPDATGCWPRRRIPMSTSCSVPRPAPPAWKPRWPPWPPARPWRSPTRKYSSWPAR